MYEPLAWVALAIAVYALATNLLWWIAADPRRFGGAGARLDSLYVAWPADTWPAVGQALLFLGIPTIALAARAGGPPAAWGIGAPISAPAVAATALVAVTVTASALGARLWLVRSTGHRATWVANRADAHSWGILALGRVALEVHWAFVRAGCLFVGLRSPTAAVYVALSLLALEAWTNPWRRSAYRDVRGAQRLGEVAALAAQSATVYLLTGSLALCVLAHLVVAAVLLLVAPEPVKSLEPDPVSAARRAM